MCTSFIVNRKKTIVGFNLDILGMEYRINENDQGVYIEIYDQKQGWLPLFGGNARGDFVGMPTCWPFDDRSDPQLDEKNILELDIDLLLMKRTLNELKDIAEKGKISSVKGSTFMGALSDRNGNVLYIIPGQGHLYYEKPDHKVMTNFSPFKMDKEKHPWMGYDRYLKALQKIETSSADFSVDDAFNILKETSQIACPTVVSMVYDVSDKTIFWCEKRNYADINKKKFYEEND